MESIGIGQILAFYKHQGIDQKLSTKFLYRYITSKLL